MEQGRTRTTKNNKLIGQFFTLTAFIKPGRVENCCVNTHTHILMVFRTELLNKDVSRMFTIVQIDDKGRVSKRGAQLVNVYPHEETGTMMYVFDYKTGVTGSKCKSMASDHAWARVISHTNTKYGFDDDYE